MLTVYKKQEKSIDNLTGVLQISDEFEDKPFIFCIGDDNKSNFELLQYSLVISRIYSSLDKNARFSLDSFPVDFLSFAYEKDKDNKSAAVELVEKCIYPYLTKNGNDFESIKKQAIKMNFLVFSKGLQTYEEIELLIKEKLKSNQFKDNEIEEILSHISLTCVGGKITNKKLSTSTTYFVDVNDDESTNRNSSFKNLLTQKGSKNMCGSLKKDVLYIFEGNGEHNLDNYFMNGEYSLSGLAIVIAYYIENSLRGILPISANGIFSYLSDNQFENSDSKTVLSMLDKKLSFLGAEKFTDYDAKLREELDNAYAKILSLESVSNVNDNNKITQILSEVSKRVSDTTYYQILANLGMIEQVDQSVLSRKNDREIIEGIQSLFSINTDIPKKLEKK